MTESDRLEPINTDTAAPDRLAQIRARTPARILVGRTGTAYRTTTQLELREDHAFAIDAVRDELDVDRDLRPALAGRFDLFELSSRARSKAEYLMRPDLGRELDEAAGAALRERCGRGAPMLVAIGDGLSVAAVRAQVPALLLALEAEARARGGSFGPAIPVFRYARVGLLNALGQWLEPEVAILLIGERPGLATAESLSAYMAFRPRPGQTDADRNLISNIHARGVDPAQAAARIVALAVEMRRLGTSGIAVKERLEPPAPGLNAPAPAALASRPDPTSGSLTSGS